jgi:hypothetical protein
MRSGPSAPSAYSAAAAIGESLYHPASRSYTRRRRSAAPPGRAPAARSLREPAGVAIVSAAAALDEGLSAEAAACSPPARGAVAVSAMRWGVEGASAGAGPCAEAEGKEEKKWRRGANDDAHPRA